MPVSHELKQAVGYVQTHAHHLRAVLTIADVITSIEDIERLAGEADTALVNKQKLADELQARLDGIKREIEAETEALAAARSETAAAKAEAKAEAKKIVDKAKSAASSIEAEARAKAGVIEAAAKDEADKVRADIVNLKAEAGRWSNKIVDLRVDHDGLLQRVEKAKSYLGKLAATGS